MFSAKRLFSKKLISKNIFCRSIVTSELTKGYLGINHVAFLVSNTKISKEFYCDLLGFVDETQFRPANLLFPGAFLRCGSSQIHLMELSSTADPKGLTLEYPGRQRHVAFGVTDLNILRNQLEKHKIVYYMSKPGRQALFCHDPDQNALEFVEEIDIEQRPDPDQEVSSSSKRSPIRISSFHEDYKD